MIQIDESIQLTAFPPKVRLSSINMAGLLTHPSFGCLPGFLRNPVAQLPISFIKAYSSGDCSGIPPDSLLIAGTDSG